MTQLTKKERVDAFIGGRQPDRIPVFPFILTQGVYECGWRLPDITTQVSSDADKCAETVLKTLEVYDYDLALGSYMDCFYGVVPLGGALNIPEEVGETVTAARFPVRTKADWEEVKSKLPIDPWKEPRVAAVLKATKTVSAAVGQDTPIAALWWPGPTAALLMLRGREALAMDMAQDADFAIELIEAANRFCIDFLRAQYEAGANSICILGEVFGVEMISPAMCERFVLPYVAEIADTIMKEFGQKTLLHIHGDFKKPRAYPLLEKFVSQAHVSGLFLDEKHSAEWIKTNVIDALGVPACVPIHGPNLVEWSLPEIEAYTRDAIRHTAGEGGVMMTPSCEIPAAVPHDNFKTWIDSVHKYGTYPISV